MSTRASAFGAVVLAAIGVGAVLVPALAQQIHRHGFAGRQTALVRWDGNVRAEEKAHEITDQPCHSQPASEHLQLLLDAGTGDSAFVHYFYELPGPARITPILSAGVWVKATRPGVELRARVVFPNEPDPARPESPLTMLIVGKKYEKNSRSWDKLTLENVPELMARHLAPIRAKIGRDVKTDGAYIDRLVLNMYTGPGLVDIWVDDLDIGPIEAPPAPSPGAPGALVRQTRPTPSALALRKVEQRGGQLLVDGKADFFKVIRHTGAPLHSLQEAGFDAVWFPPDVPAEVVAEANREGWFVIPSAPRADFESVGTAPKDAAYETFRRKYADSNILFVDLGAGLTDEQAERARKTVAAIREKGGDPRRLVGGDLWDGYQAYSNYLDVVGAHRWPLFTSLDLANYRDWLMQRRRLAGDKPVFWTWVQNHLPEWYAASVMAGPGAPPGQVYSGPVGPHPEQVRVLAYLSLAAGCRGLGFWSDQSLADSHNGMDRLQGMALLNAELKLLTPLILSAGLAGGQARWIDSKSNSNVKAAMLSGPKGLLLIPIWVGQGDQYVPPQGAAVQLKLVIPGVSEGYDPWLITPAGVKCLKSQATRTSDGLELIINEFDMVAPIVFTDDQTPTGQIVQWQNRTRETSRTVAKYAITLAKAEYEKVRTVHLQLVKFGTLVQRGDELLKQTDRYYQEAIKNFYAQEYVNAYENATRALRPLRVLMRDHWERATATLDIPTASPYAVSYYSLPQHQELMREVQPPAKLAASVLSGGAFEPATEIPITGIPINPTGNDAPAVPGWTARAGSLEVDRVMVAAGVVRSFRLNDYVVPRTTPRAPKNLFTSSRPVTASDEGYVPPAPRLGLGVLKLEIAPRPGPDGTVSAFLHPLERTFVAVDSPQVRLPPGTLVRVSAWIKVPKTIQGTADGALFYDDAGGEPLSVRLLNTNSKDARGNAIWKHYHLYRRVPASGQIGVTVALTGYGVAYFDDIKIEPIVPAGK